MEQDSEKKWKRKYRNTKLKSSMKMVIVLQPTTLNFAKSTINNLMLMSWQKDEKQVGWCRGISWPKFSLFHPISFLFLFLSVQPKSKWCERIMFHLILFLYLRASTMVECLTSLKPTSAPCHQTSLKHAVLFFLSNGSTPSIMCLSITLSL